MTDTDAPVKPPTGAMTLRGAVFLGIGAMVGGRDLRPARGGRQDRRCRGVDLLSRRGSYFCRSRLRSGQIRRAPGTDRRRWRAWPDVPVAAERQSTRPPGMSPHQVLRGPVPQFGPQTPGRPCHKPQFGASDAQLSRPMPRVLHARSHSRSVALVPGACRCPVCAPCAGKGDCAAHASGPGESVAARIRGLPADGATG